MALVQKIIGKRILCPQALLHKDKDVPKPFNQIPGPRSLPIIGSSWKYMPFLGDWDSSRLHDVGTKRFEQFGGLVREEISPGLNLVHAYRAQDIEKIYKNEGKYPERLGHLALMHYRLCRPHLYNSGGLLPTNGIEWWRLRSTFQKHIARVQDARFFLPRGEEIINDFVSTTLSNNYTSEDFLPLLSRLYLELMWMFIFGKRLGSFDEINISVDSVPSKLMKAAENITHKTMITDSTEKIWKIIKTPSYIKIEKNFEYIEKIVLNALKVAKAENDKCTTISDENAKSCLVDKFFQTPEISSKDVNAMTADLVLGGVDTTAYTTAFLMYNLSRNKEVQAKLYAEAVKLLPSPNAKITSDILNSAVYARAVLKESLRLNPVSIGISRFLQQDMVFSGYLVPKGTLMVTQNLVACRNEENFKNALDFIPERWIRDSPAYQEVSPYLVLPFSHGPRTCIARRLAEQNMLTLLLTIIRKYSISWMGEVLDIETPLTCKPDKAVKLSFHNWDEKNKNLNH
ncbi:cytochrome P450 302a1, mitochondrial [Halyomorpha halys]|uniref:cytochrome P450 302a1, mitochondrial n=1 Tax=Halyomorpha halys TaxID=286706 RepID=UPI0006D4DDE4|nr:cytochrome P450 302a1, mitochondrial [Halyomorpha halys]